MNGMKINAALIFAMALQACALVWFLSQQNSKIDTLYTEFEQQNKKEVIENQVKMKLDLENLIADVQELQKDTKKMQSKEKELLKQTKKIDKDHQKLFRILEGDNSNRSYSYGE